MRAISDTAETAKEANPGKGASFNSLNSTSTSTANEYYRPTVPVAN